MVRLSHLYMTVGKTTVLTIQNFVSKVMSMLFNMLFRFVITSLPRSRCLLISLLESLSPMILVPKKTTFVTAFYSFYLPQNDGTECHDLCFFNIEFHGSFFILLFHPHQEALSSSSYSAFTVVSAICKYCLDNQFTFLHFFFFGIANHFFLVTRIFKILFLTYFQICHTVL